MILISNLRGIGVRSCYDEGKRVAETLMFDYHRQHGIGTENFLIEHFNQAHTPFLIFLLLFFLIFCNFCGAEIRVARIFNTYGPRMNIDDGRVVSNFIAQALR